MAEPIPATGTTSRGVAAYIPQTGETRDLDTESMNDLWKHGAVQTIEGHTYAIQGPDGSIWHVPASEVPDAMRHGGVFAKHEDNVRAEVAAEPGWKPALQGAFNAATAGTGEAILKAGNAADPIGLAARQERPEYVAGQIGGAMLTAAVAPQALLGNAARAAVAESVAQTAVGRLLAAGAGAAVEGATYSAGNAISEASLGKTEDVAEHLLAATGAGALLSGTAGMVARGAGEVLGRGLANAAGRGKRLLNQAAGGLADHLEPLEGQSYTGNPLDISEAPAWLTQATGAVATRGAKVAAGSALGGPVGALVGMAAGGDSRLNRTVGKAVLNYAQRAIRKVNDNIDAHAEALASGSERVAEGGRYMERALAGTTTALLTATSPEERQKAYETRMQELTALQDPATASAVMERATSHLGEDMPDTRGFMQLKGSDALAYLAKNMPRTFAVDTLAPVPALPDHDITTFARLDAVLQDPMRAMRSDATRQEVQAVQTVYPALGAKMQRAIVGVISPGLAWGARKSLAAAWGIQTHAAFTASSIALSQSLHKAARNSQQQRGPGRPKKQTPMDVSGYLSPVQKATGNR